MHRGSLFSIKHYHVLKKIGCQVLNQRKNKIGIAGVVIQNGQRKATFDDKVVNLLKVLVENNQVYLLDYRRKFNCINEFPAINVNAQREEQLAIQDLDLIYFGMIAGNEYPLVADLDSFLHFLESLMPYEYDPNKDEGIIFLNPSKTLITNFSKQYLLDLAEKTDLPIIPGKKINSLDELLGYAQASASYIAKPLISELAKGVILLHKKRPEELALYYEQYESKKYDGQDLYSRVMSGQGVMVQPFMKDFGLIGERKIGIIDGEITTGRIIYGASDQISILSSEFKDFIYEPTFRERELVKRVYTEYNKLNKATYMRVDITGSADNLQINEIEVINPYFYAYRFPQKTKQHTTFLCETIERCALSRT